jgi:PspA/IM30 family/Helix-turn-helix domain
MGYQLRMHAEIRDWLAGLRDTEPELARLVGEAVMARLDAGEALGPPLVVPLESVLRAPDDPGEVLDASYQHQLENLTLVRRGVADVATSRKRIELQANTLEHQATKLASQREKALSAGREDLASEAQARETRVREQLSELRRQFAILTDEEEKLTVASQRLQAKVEAFRIRKETIKASFTATEASQRVRDAIADIDADASDLGEAETEDASPGPAAGEPPQRSEDTGPATEGGSGPQDQDAGLPPPGMMELRPGAPGPVRASLLFVVEPQDTALLVAHVEHPGGLPGEYQEAIRIAADRLTLARSRPVAATASPSVFISYDAASFLDEFFPGEETEVEIGAGALAARNRAHTLAEARQRMRLTQAQVARRMKVRQERVSAIERAAPGATEVRTLAAYVHALGGRLEIIAHIGDDRINLR